MTTSRTHMLVLTGLCIALIAVGAFITVPLGPVPFTLQTLMIGIALCLLPPRFAVGAIGGYLLLGCLGLPIFSGFKGGIGVFAGPTGGFLVGFLVATLVIALVRSVLLAPRSKEAGQTTKPPSWHRIAVDSLTLVLLLVIYNIFGCLWFMVSTGVTFEAALVACFVPFIVPDLIKMAAALLCAGAIRTALGTSLAMAR